MGGCSGTLMPNSYRGREGQGPGCVGTGKRLEWDRHNPGTRGATRNWKDLP